MVESIRSLMQDMPVEDSAVEDLSIEVGEDEEQPAATFIIDAEGNAVAIEVVVDDKLVPFEQLPHTYNFAHRLNKETADKLGQELIELVEADDQARSDWVRLLEEGMKLLNLKLEEKNEPWPGASAVKHPLILDAAVRYQSDTIREIMPPSGPAEVKVFGKQSAERLAHATRIKNELNYQTCYVMKSYKTGLEQTLLATAFGGAAYRKIRRNPARGENEAKFVPATDIIRQYGAATLYECDRYAHRQTLTETQWEFMEHAEDWISDPDPQGMPTSNSTDDTNEEALGLTKNYLDKDITVYEIYTYLDCEDLFGGEEPEVPAPFIVVVDKETQTIRSIKRNWREDDPNKKPLEHFSEYSYIPSPWGMPLGLIHIIGGLTEAGTALLQQMIDAGTLNNVPSGFKSRGLKISRNDDPIQPGEFRDIETIDGSKIRDHIEFMPSKPVDATSLQLLQGLTEMGQKLASAADIKASDATGSATGAMMAVLERALSVMSAVQSRAADGVATELNIMARLIGEHESGPYAYEVEGGQFDKGEDFRIPVGIVCVADPSASTQAMRILRDQAITAQAAQKPDLYDQAELHRRVMRNLGVEDVDTLIPRAGDTPKRDPISENQALLMGQSVQAYMDQDHAAHIAVHMMAMENPGIQAFVGQSQNGPAIIAAAQAHLAEHISFQYRQMMAEQMGMQLPPPGEPLPADIENQLAQMAAQVKLPPLGQAAQQQEPQPDPIVELQKQELQLKQADLQLKAEKLKLQNQADQLRAEIALRQDETRGEAAQLSAQVEMMRIQSENANAAADRQVQLGLEAEKILQTDRIEGTKAGIQAAKVQQAAEQLKERTASVKDIKGDSA